MSIFIILVPFIFLFILFYRMNRCWRSSVLSTSIIWGLLLVVITEFLNIFRLINFKAIMLSWTIVSLILGLTLYIISRKKLSDDIKQPVKEGLGIYLKTILALTGIYIFVTGLTAFVAAPNNYDSMTYHMSRVIHWIQNSSIAHYPTNIVRQLYAGPLAEYIILHLQIITGADYFANLVQWFSFIGCIIGVSLISKLLKADIRGQIFSSAIVAAIPMGILQASSTQNDLVTSFWLVCFVYYLLNLMKTNNNKSIILYSCASGISLGLALLTKATAYIFAFPFLILFAVSIIKDLKAKAFKPILIVLLIPFLINLGHISRNYELFGSIFSSKEEAAMQLNQKFAPKYLVSSILKNISLQIQTPSDKIDKNETQRITKIDNFMGVNVNEIGTNFNNEKFKIYSLFNHEDFAGNPIHFCLILLCIFIFFISGKYDNKEDLRNYLFALTAGFLLFCFVLKWQPWGSRLQLPLFVLFCPFVGKILSEISKHKLVNAAVILIILSSSYYVFFNQTRQLFAQKYVNLSIFNVKRTDQYLFDLNKRADYSSASKLIENIKCQNIGLITGRDDEEYPLLVLLRQNIKGVRVEHIFIKNPSKNIHSDYFDSFMPCAIISTNDADIKQIIYKKHYYEKEYSSKTLNVFVNN